MILLNALTHRGFAHSWGFGGSEYTFRPVRARRPDASLLGGHVVVGVWEHGKQP